MEGTDQAGVWLVAASGIPVPYSWDVFLSCFLCYCHRPHARVMLCSSPGLSAQQVIAHCSNSLGGRR
jgi:hypothetical protein